MAKSKQLVWKIFIFLVGFCFLLLVILWVFQTVFLSKMYESTRRKELNDAIQLIEQNIDNPDLNEIIKGLANSSEIFVTPERVFSSPDGPKVRDALTETRNFQLSDGHEISLVFYATVTPVNATISTIKKQLYYVTALMLVLSVCLAFLLARYIAKPIEQLNEEAKKLAQGEYEIHFSGASFKEVQELSNTLNYTATELSKVETLRKELMANISHDLRTPLALIYSYAEMMHDFPEEMTKEQTQLIMDETSRLSSLVQDLLRISQIEAGTLQLSYSTFDITTEVSQFVDKMNHLLEKDDYKIHFNYDEHVVLSADKSKLMQVIYNLVSNAINYGGEDHEVFVTQEVENGKIFICVKDNGIGISEEDIPFIWDRYYKVDTTHQRSVVGTGLGLSIVKKIMALHDGTYGVESQSEQGSTFWISLKKIDTV